MFKGAIKKAVEDYKLLEILYYVKETGIDYRLDLDKDNENLVGVYFTFKHKEHYMLLDDIIFDFDDEGLGLMDKFYAIMNEVIHVFNLANSPITELEDVIKKEFEVNKEIVNKNERVDVKVFGYTNSYDVKVVITNNDTNKKRKFQWYFEHDTMNYSTVSEVGYKVAHDLMEIIEDGAYCDREEF